MDPSNDVEISDKFNLTFILMYCFGTLAQISGSIFPNAQLYWKYKFRNTEMPWNPSSNTTTELQNEFTADFAVVGNATSILALILSIALTKKWNINYRIIGCFPLYVLLFVVIVIFVGVDTDSWQREFLYVTLFSIFLIGCVNSMFLVALFQMCSTFSPRYISAMVSGQALCGIFTSSLQIITLSINANPSSNGFLYFSSTVVFVVLVAVMYTLCLKFSPFINYHLKQNSPKDNTKNEVPKELLWSILKRQKFAFISFMVLTGTSSMVHPGITATIQSADTGSKWNDTFFVPVITFFVYNCIDLLGRELALRVKKPSDDIPVLSMTFLRILLVPVLLFCNLTSKEHTSVLFDNDAVYITVIIVLAFSNGYLTNICIMMLPKNYDGTNKDRAVTIIMIFVLLLVGTGVFSFLGLALLKVM